MGSRWTIRDVPPPGTQSVDGAGEDVRQLCERLQRLIDPVELALVRAFEACGSHTAACRAPCGQHRQPR